MFLLSTAQQDLNKIIQQINQNNLSSSKAFLETKKFIKFDEIN